MNNRIESSMLSPYLKISSGTNRQQRHWYHLSTPDMARLTQISHEFQIDLGYLSDTLDTNERPNFYHEGDTQILFLRVPVTREEDGVKVPDTQPIGIFHQGQRLLTISMVDLPIFDQVRDRLIKRNDSPRLRDILAEFIQTNARDYLHNLLRIKNDINDMESALRNSQNTEDFYAMLSIQDSLAKFVSSLRGNIAVIQRFAQNPIITEDEDDLEEINDSLIDLQQAREMAELYAATLTDLLDAYVGVLQNNIGNRLKKLTAWTVVLAVSLMSTSLYGMNIPLPLEHWRYATPLVLGLGFFAAGILYWYFRRNDWI